MFFYLNPHTFFVKGKMVSVLYNLRIGELIKLDVSETEILEKAEKGIELDDRSLAFFKDLEKMEYGTLSEVKIFIDKHRHEHEFLKTRMDLNSPSLLTVFIRITENCNLVCKNAYFCPVCFSCSKSTLDRPFEFWHDILDRLCSAGAVSFIITGGNPFLYEHIEKVVAFLKQKKKLVTIVTNGCGAIPNISGINLIVISCDYHNINRCALKAYHGVFLVPVEMENIAVLDGFDKQPVLSTMQYIDSERQLSPCFEKDFHGRNGYDDCLKGKMYVDSDGTIVPCFQRKNEAVGNFKDFYKSYRNLVTNYWNARYKARMKDKKCAVCELFFACHTCSAFTPEINCCYNPDSGDFEPTG